MLDGSVDKMLHGLLLAGEMLFALLGLCLIGAGWLSFNALNSLESKKDGRVLHDKFNATQDRLERWEITKEALAGIGDFWRSTPATRWSIYVGLGMLACAALCEWLQ